jgi:ABC-type branched-subunit amino acid transport system ATPase component
LTDPPVRRPLRVEEVSVRFGGLRALDEVTVTVGPAAIVGLIGPNGAGKTTLFNCITGTVVPNRGRILLFDDDVTRVAPHRRARLGVGRTFQRLELFRSLSVLENLVVALESHAGRGGVISDMLALPSSVETRAQAEARAAGLLELVGIPAQAAARAGDLPIGMARLVEVARALGTEPDLLLLDEPTSGLRRPDSARLAALLRRVRDERGTSVFIVEHDMGFVLDLCEWVYVLDFGRVLAEGTPADIRSNPQVQAAYLGEEVDDGAAARR